MRVPSGIALGAVALALAAAAVAVLVLRGPALPSEAAGRAWLDGFADSLTSSATWSARGPAALAPFPGLGPWSGKECVLEWSRRTPSDPVVTYQRLELGRLNAAEPCEDAQFGMLSTTICQSEGITPGGLAERFTARFGPPAIHRGTGLRDAVTYRWLLQDGIFAHLEERVQPGGADTFSLLFLRSYASPTTLAGPDEAEQWLVRTVDLVTGPDLPRARGAAIPPMLGVPMRSSASRDADCPTEFYADLLVKGPIATGQSLLLERPDGAPCAEARFSWLSMRIWGREPVTATALVKRIGDRLGAATLSRDFERDAVKYGWTTPHGTAVELTEELSDTGRPWLSLRTWRP